MCNRNDGEITLKFGNGYKNVLCIQCKDCYKEFVCIKYECPIALNGFSYFYYSDNAISYREYIMGYNILAQPHGPTRSL